MPSKKYPQLNDADFLRREYLENNKNAGVIAREIGCTDHTVRWHLNRHGIRQTVRNSRELAHPSLEDKEWLTEQYHTCGLAVYQIAENLGCHRASVYRAMLRHNIPRRGLSNPCVWKGKKRPDHGKKVSAALKGRRPSDQCLAASAEANRNKVWTDEMREEMSKSISRYYENNPGPWSGAYGEANPNWRGGISILPYSFEFTEELKESIRTRDSRRCQLCDMTEKEHLERHNRKLCVHHIDYDKQRSLGENLIALCIRCHSQTNGNRAYWKMSLSQLLTERGIAIDPANQPVNVQLRFPGFIL